MVRVSAFEDQENISREGAKNAKEDKKSNRVRMEELGCDCVFFELEFFLEVN